MMTENELSMLQHLPLDLKVAKSMLRIEEWIRFQGVDHCYVSFSGGKDSTVLHHLVKAVEMRMFGEIKIPRVFSDTGLEYPELRQFVFDMREELGDLLVVIRPVKSFLQVLKEEGYPIISKINARKIHDLQNPTWKNVKSRHIYLTGESSKGGKSPFKLAKKWLYLKDADFQASHKCCDYMKKKPFKQYERDTQRLPFIGVMAAESRDRKISYLENGCNAFNSSRPQSRPMGFWRETDVLEYIKTNNLEIPSVYGEVIQQEDGTYTTTGVKRTGCVFCAFGVQFEDKNLEKNRFEMLKETHPQLYSYCINGGRYIEVECYKEVKSINSDKVMYFKTKKKIWIPHQGLGMGHVLDVLGLRY